MSANQLPENIGKKIVDALKKQSYCEEDYTPRVFVNTEEHKDNSEQKINELPEQHVEFFELPEHSATIDTAPMQFSISEPTPLTFTAPELPTNVAVLKKLINQLPAGVSKQVGAQIIRQTVEALGISMHSVLQEAQQVQDGLSSALKDCSIKMQEYKNQIMQLEANSRDFQHQMSQVNDLINLFILTDNKRG